MTIPPLSAASPLSNTLTGFLLGIVTVVGFHACLYLGAYWFFAKHLYRDYEIKRLSIQNLFSATFTVCVSMLQLLLLELLHILNPTVRKWVWNIDLVCVLLLLYLILPVFIVYNLLVPEQDIFRIPDLASAFPRLQSLNLPGFSIASLSIPTSLPLPASLNFPSSLSQHSRGKLSALLPHSPIPWHQWVLVALGCAVFLPFLWSCFYQSGRFLHLDPAILASLSYTECLLAYVGVCGVTVVSALAGFGSVNYPYKNITAFLSPVSQEQVAEVEQRLLQTLTLIAEKKKKRKQLQQSLTRPGRSSHWPTPTTGLHPAGSACSSRALFDARTSGKASNGFPERDGVTVFVHGGAASSEAMCALSSSGSDMETGSLPKRGERHPDGLFVQGDRVGADCGARSDGAQSLNIVRVAAALRGQAAEKECEQLQIVSPYLSLLLLGWIIALTIRGFIEKLLAVFRYVSTSVSSNVFALVMSEIMGFYFSACVLLTRVYLPQSYRDAVTEIIAPSLDFRVFHLHFDRVFLLSSLTSLGIIMLSHKHTLEKFKSL
ncbi:GA20816, related [Neospora caninum Liverpool]|uniref:GA20816, related n=1 Tax=Neospora caninum (strain Liverpool) TaxID=572307 RepID=F0VDA4_NEOCL|nr:GA20816, related [Neospora caninum Liverpool]CBZ51619.1 GA20816, related [Neospora caninum Liverpool]|eukprot:XP_003881652.1 GA20816, related [Neospora caninum Liverpool]